MIASFLDSTPFPCYLASSCVIYLIRERIFVHNYKDSNPRNVSISYVSRRGVSCQQFLLRLAAVGSV